MRVYKDGVEYHGSPADIAELWSYSQTKTTYAEPSDEMPNFELDDFKPYEDLENVVAEAEDVRKKLAEDPNYNPYGGVVPSKESEPDINPSVNTFTAEEDTGVTLQ